MYDIHCHILPELDDGPDNLADSLEMARIAAADGFQCVIATPHEARVVAAGGKESLERRVQAYRVALASHQIPLEMAMGVEYLLTMDLVQQAKQRDAITLNGSRYLLVEIDFFQYPSFCDEALFQIQMAGYVPILAHPERQDNIQEKPELLEGLVRRGVLSEVTAGSVLGSFGSQAQRSAQRLLADGLVHFIASDAHSRRGPRTPVMAEARDAVARLVGEEAAHAMAVLNPRAVLDDAPVVTPPINATQRRRFPWLGRSRP